MDATVKYISDLVNHLLARQTPEEMTGALRELLTDSELAEIANRLQIFQMLKKGIPQRRIAGELGVGIATVTRGSKAIKPRQSSE
ncbi:MAG: Trp family transcriptional regulator [Pseudomonadota bacterium]